MIRIVLFAALFSLCMVTLALPVSSSWAGDGKGVLGFFNRNKNSESDQNKPTAPVYMKPMQRNNSTGDRVKPVDLSGTKSSSKVARYEDSSIFKQSLDNDKSLNTWNTNEVAAAEANTAMLMQRIEAEQAQAKAASAQLDMQQMAQNKNRMVPPSGMTAYGAQPLPTSIAATPVKPGTDEGAENTPADEGTSGVRKPRHFFNRSE